ncbi:hypothetical protein B9479_005721 [Cryptococcus floricola]|uniref:Uncharacterized protein n=1 Tax=Cryptococcus floricola TaxID=2591691 RepID=A0A5D3ASE6_9TREE|nr:hypothetical protein B9479_005721 [Cryptococcus floricola]
MSDRGSNPPEEKPKPEEPAAGMSPLSSFPSFPSIPSIHPLLLSFSSTHPPIYPRIRRSADVRFGVGSGKWKVIVGLYPARRGEEVKRNA